MAQYSERVPRGKVATAPPVCGLAGQRARQPRRAPGDLDLAGGEAAYELVLLHSNSAPGLVVLPFAALVEDRVLMAATPAFLPWSPRPRGRHHHPGPRSFDPALPVVGIAPSIAVGRILHPDEALAELESAGRAGPCRRCPRRVALEDAPPAQPLTTYAPRSTSVAAGRPLARRSSPVPRPKP